MLELDKSLLSLLFHLGILLTQFNTVASDLFQLSLQQLGVM